jgi:hypothetical protein
MDKYFKCMSCGAIAKAIVPCDCENCGINCCGKQMEVYTPTEDELKIKGKVITCDACKAEVEEIVPCTCDNCGIKCCGEQMK